MSTQELTTARLSEAQIGAIHALDHLIVPSTEQLLLYHGPELFTNVVAFSPVPHRVVSIDGRILRVNDVFRELTGAGDESVTGMSLESVIAEPSRALTNKKIELLRSKRQTTVEWTAAFRCIP